LRGILSFRSAGRQRGVIEAKTADLIAADASFDGSFIWR